jgi:malate dehydrogenase (oxaloacetate-decarboxylating)
VTIAALINVLKLTGRKFEHTRFVLFGAGAANTCIYRYLKVFGARPENIIVTDSKGVLHRERPDLEEMRRENPWKYRIAVESNLECIKEILKAFEGADVVIAASRPGPCVIKKKWIRLMNKDAIVFAEANPIPELWPVGG